jgi:ATP-dependent DNA helicase
MADLQQQLEESSSDGDPDFDENEKEQENIAELQNMEEQQRYRRLQHLLEKSSIYSMFLLQRMNNQRDEDKRAYRRKTRTKKVPAKDTMQENFTKGKTYSLRRKRQASEATVSPAKQTSQSKRKRIGCKDTNYKIENYIDEKGHLRKSSAAVARHIDDTSASQEEEEEEDADEIRMIDNKEVSSRQPLLFTGGVMRGYQLDGMEWLKVLFENGVNGILGDEMGLGKTVQCIGFIAHLVENGVKGPYLVVGPLSTLPNWCSEFQRFTPEVPVVLYHGNQEERELLRRKHFSSRKRTSAHSDSPLPVVITSYEMCLVDRKFFQCQEWKYLVVDEGQRIKNLNCKLIQTLKTFKAANRLLLTGTPLQNNLAELWSLLNFLLPDIFDDLNCFQQYFDFTAVGEHSGNEKILAQEREQSVLSTLHQILTPFLLRRLKSDVELKIPPKKEVMVYAPISPLQAKLYKAVLEENILDLLGDKNTKNGKTITVAIGEESKAVIGGDCPVEETPSKTRRKCTSRTDILMKLQSDDHFMGKLLEGEASYSEEYRRHWFPQPAVEEEKPKSSVVNVSLLGKTMQLRKCINHPYLIEFPLTKEGDYRIDEDIVRVSGKMLLLDKLLAALLQRGHKV